MNCARFRYQLTNASLCIICVSGYWQNKEQRIFRHFKTFDYLQFSTNLQ